MSGILSVYRAAVLMAVFYAKKKDSTIGLECDMRWRRSLARMSAGALLRQLRRFIRACSERSIGLMHAAGVFKKSSECLRIAAETVLKRRTEHFAVVVPLIAEYNEHRGKSRFHFIRP